MEQNEELEILSELLKKYIDRVDINISKEDASVLLGDYFIHERSGTKWECVEIIEKTSILGKYKELTLWGQKET